MKEAYERRKKEKTPVLAVCYDFDKTLSPDDMQAQGYIQSVGLPVKRFWKEADELARKNEMDGSLAYMLKMVREAEGNLVLTRKALENYGAGVALYPGVAGWFSRLKAYGEAHGVKVEHYVISSGLREMIEGTAPGRAGAFEKIYASSFYYNGRGVAAWPAQVINFTAKTQFLFRISKGVLDVNDPAVNEYFKPEDIRIPFRNIVYIGDSDTDIPCMKLVRSYGGHSIGVYDPEKGNDKKVKKLMLENRIGHIAPADYRKGSPLDKLLLAIIEKTERAEALEEMHVRDLKSAEKS